jgi:hypothetical protein
MCLQDSEHTPDGHAPLSVSLCVFPHQNRLRENRNQRQTEDGKLFHAHQNLESCVSRVRSVLKRGTNRKCTRVIAGAIAVTARSPRACYSSEVHGTFRHCNVCSATAFIVAVGAAHSATAAAIAGSAATAAISATAATISAAAIAAAAATTVYTIIAKTTNKNCCATQQHHQSECKVLQLALWHSSRSLNPAVL